jgi:hypothetical protein
MSGWHSAFPSPTGNPDQDGRVTLLDYFAAKAMAALLSQQYGVRGMYDPNDPAQAVTLAYLSYQAADAMLKERERHL